MNEFLIKRVTNKDVVAELCKIGFDNSYVEAASKKFCYENLKVYSLNFAQANVLKQTAISVGADCATHRETITAKIEFTDCILGGSISQLEKIAQKLKVQPFGLSVLAEKIESELIRTTKTPKIVGILNVTPDSFSDGGEYLKKEAAVKKFNELIKDGASLVDIGGESTRPKSSAVSPKEQLKRILPILKSVDLDFVSVDTRSSEVARECLSLGVKVINDVSGLSDKKMGKVVADVGAKIVIGHNFCAPDDGTDEIFKQLNSRAEYALSEGILRENIILDVGIGFSKTREQNLAVLNSIGDFASLGYPLMVGISRKSFLNVAQKDNFFKDALTLALNVRIWNDADYLRVHNVALYQDLGRLIK